MARSIQFESFTYLFRFTRFQIARFRPWFKFYGSPNIPKCAGNFFNTEPHFRPYISETFLRTCSNEA